MDVVHLRQKLAEESSAPMLGLSVVATMSVSLGMSVTHKEAAKLAVYLIR
jgi:hypothetical protein